MSSLLGTGFGGAIAGDVTIRWPDGATSAVEGVAAGSHVRITREGV